MLLEGFGLIKLLSGFELPTVKTTEFHSNEYYTNNERYYIVCYLVDESKLYLRIETPSLISYKPHSTKDEWIEKTVCKSITKNYYIYFNGKVEEIQFNSLLERSNFELNLIDKCDK